MEIFKKKNQGEYEAGRIVSDLFLFFKNTSYWSRDMLNFQFLEEGLGIVSPPHFVFNLPRKKFLMLYSSNWPNNIVWLLLLSAILGNMCFVNIC